MPAAKLKVPLTAAIPAINPADPLVAVRDLMAEASGKRPSPVTVYRIVSGRTQPRLPALSVSGRWCTTRPVYYAWLAVRSAKRLAKAGVIIDATDDELAAAGLSS
jgi:hypothetical protein